MDKQKLREWMLLSLYDELSEHEEHELQNLLETDSRAQDEYAELKKLHLTIEKAEKPPPADSVLVEARHGLRAIMKYEQARKPVNRRLSETVSIWKDLIPRFRHTRLVLTGVSMMLLGYFVGSGHILPQGDGPTNSSTMVSGSQLLGDSDVEISNVVFLDADASDGTVEFVLEAIRPILIKGTLDDPNIQRVLAHAVVNEQNPGVRLRAINTVSTSQYDGGPIDEMKQALVMALKTDPNSGVRSKAFTTLVQFPFDGTVKDALLHVLMNDDNAALRIEAINQLQNVSPENLQDDQIIVEALQSRVDNDENRFIRLQAMNVLKKISNP